MRHSRALTLAAVLLGLVLLVGIHLTWISPSRALVSDGWRASLYGLASARSFAGQVAGTAGVEHGSDSRRRDGASADAGRAPDPPRGSAEPSTARYRVSPLPASEPLYSSSPAALAPDDTARGSARQGEAATADSSAARDSAATPTAAPAEPAARGVRLRVLHWNIFEGGASKLPAGWAGAPSGARRATRLEAIAAFVGRGGERGGTYDVVTCNELNGIHAAAWARLGALAGLPHVRLLARSPFHIGVLSRHALEPVLERTGAPFAHGLLCVRLLASGLEVCVTHLDPHSSRARAREAAAIARHVATRGGPLVLLGDLNTLSPLDRREHSARGLVRRIRSGARSKQLVRKFLTSDPLSAEEAAAAAGGAAGAPAHEPAGGSGGSGLRIDYAPMQRLLDAPLLDLGARTHAGAHTVPTRVNADRMHFTRMRLDFCLLSAALGRSCRAGEPAAAPHSNATRAGCWAHAVVSDETEQLSDHFPLDVQLVVAPTRGGERRP